MINPNADLIAAARAVVGDMRLNREASAGGVGAAIRTAGGNVCTGICIDLPSGLGFCAEVAAIAQMVTHRETRIDTVVAVAKDAILPPCGRCRETMAQFDARNLDCRVIVGEERVVRLRDLLPEHWLTPENERT
jgi:cytidine deaminase